MNFPSWFPEVATILGILVAARAIGEAFVKVAAITRTDRDDRAARRFMKIIDTVGRLFAWIGIGNHKR